MAHLYEGMFLLDNEAVRSGWGSAKALISELIVKHGGKVVSARRWGERKLAYPIRRRQRGTYLLTYYEMPREGIPTLVRDLDLCESLLRYLLLHVEAVPATEAALAAAESAPDYAVPVPPSDEAGSYSVLQGNEANAEEGAEGAAEEVEAPETNLAGAAGTKE